MGTPVVTGLGALNTAYTLTGTPANRTFTLTGTNPLTSDVATVTWTLTRSGYASIIKKFTISRVKNGVAGTSPTLYRLIPSTNAIAKDIAGVYNPTTLTVTGKSQTGTGTYGDYAGRFIIADSTNGTTFTDRYTSAGNEVSKVYTPSAGIKALRVRLYLAGGTTTMLDEQIIPVVADGQTGANAIYAYVWNPDGNTVKNSTGSVICKMDLYSGSDKVTGSAFKWYLQDPTATTASGGDADGGNGWRLINAGYNVGCTGYSTDTLTVPATAIAGTEAFKCVVTYSSVKYSGVTTVVDLSDPIVVRLDGINMFKNGQGSVSIRATLLQAGVEIDASGTGGYTYSWAIYNSANVKTAFTATGKTINVNSSEINGRGNLVCDVSK